MNYEGYLIDKNNNRVIPNQDFFKKVGELSLNDSYLTTHNQWITITYPTRNLNNEFLEWSNGKFIIKKAGLYLFNIAYDYGAQLQNEAGDVLYKIDVNDISITRDICRHATRAGRNLSIFLEFKENDIVNPQLYLEAMNDYSLYSDTTWLNIYYIR